MIDLHSHILPSIDDGAADLSVSLEMARAWVVDGVTTIACTPHILPGLSHNTGLQIRQAVQELQRILDHENIPLRLVAGADAHIVQDFVPGLRSGRILSLADIRYVLVEPPHHVAPPRTEEFFFDVMTGGYMPILTHPERLTWIKSSYPTVKAGSARRLDADHGGFPDWHLVVTRPKGVLANVSPSGLPMPEAIIPSSEVIYGDTRSHAGGGEGYSSVRRGVMGSMHGISERLQQLFR